MYNNKLNNFKNDIKNLELLSSWNVTALNLAGKLFLTWIPLSTIDKFT